MPKPLTHEEMMKAEHADSAPKPLSNEEMQSLEAQSSPNPRDPYTAMESGLIGAAQGATMGFEPQIEGAARGAYDVATSDKPLSGDGLLAAYRQRRDAAKLREDQARADNPKSYLTGNIAGTIGTGFIPGLGVLNAGREAGTAAKVGLAAATGAVGGAGYSDADLTTLDPEQYKKFGKDIVHGAATGLVAGTLAEGVGGAAQSMLPKSKPQLSPENYKWFHPFGPPQPPAPGILDKISEANPQNVQVYDKVADALPFGLDRTAKFAAPIVRPPVDALAQKGAEFGVEAAKKINQVLNTEGAQSVQRLIQPIIDAANAGNKSAALTITLIRMQHPSLIPQQGAQQ